MAPLAPPRKLTVESSCSGTSPWQPHVMSPVLVVKEACSPRLARWRRRVGVQRVGGAAGCVSVVGRAPLCRSGEHFIGFPCGLPEAPSFLMFVGGGRLCGARCHALSYAGVRLTRTRLDFARWALLIATVQSRWSARSRGWSCGGGGEAPPSSPRSGGGGLRAWNGLQRRQAGLPTFP